MMSLLIWIPYLRYDYYFKKKNPYNLHSFITARQISRGHIKYLGYQIQNTRFGKNTACQLGPGDVQDVVTAFTTQTNDPRDNRVTR